MTSYASVSRRSFLAAVAAAPIVPALAQSAKIPVGIEMYSVRDDLTKDLMGTSRAIAKMGYQVMEYYSPYFNWTTDQAKQVRAILDEFGAKCNSTHNDARYFTDENLSKAIEMNHILGAKYMVMASPGRVSTLDEFKALAERLTTAHEKLRAAKMAGGYHNHQNEFKPIDGKRPIEVIAANTPKDFMMQLDVGTCVEVGSDPVAWIEANPGRIKCIHCKDWAAGPDKGYKVLFGEGDAPWKKIFAAAESKGGIEYYLIEQEGSRFPPLETAEKCLENWKKMRA
jgi:sugar phosphate isomerase/epimerase